MSRGRGQTVAMAPPPRPTTANEDAVFGARDYRYASSAAVRIMLYFIYILHSTRINTDNFECAGFAAKASPSGPGVSTFREFWPTSFFAVGIDLSFVDALLYSWQYSFLFAWIFFVDTVLLCCY